MADTSKPVVVDDRYELIRPLQVGPLASTYLAKRIDDGDLVVIKELAIYARGDSVSEDDTLKRIELLEREGKILRHLDHPGIPRFVETFRTDDGGRLSLWLVQEHREGRTLREMVDDGWHGSADDVARILRQVAEVLGYLHSRVPPIVHRDIKPANIILGSDGQLSVVDLGAACTRVLTQSEGSTIVGTPGYVPLEQFAGHAVPASDVYALGMVGVYLVTHESPLSLIGDEGAVRYRQLTSVDHPTLLGTIDRMVEPLVSRRLVSAREVLAHLDGEVVEAAPRSRWRPTQIQLLSAVAAVALVASGAVTTWALTRGDHATSTTPPEVVADDELQLGEYDDDVDVEADVTDTAVVAIETPKCEVTARAVGDAGGDPRNYECRRLGSPVEPMVVGPGRIRTLLTEHPDTDDDDELDHSGWLDADDTELHWVVDFTVGGHEVIGATGCPYGSSLLAAATSRNGRISLACTDSMESLHHVEFDPRRKLSRIVGSFAFPPDEELDYYWDYTDDGASAAYRPVLAVPDRGPAMLIYPSTYGVPDDMSYSARVQPLARGARPFSLLPTSQLSEIGEWVIYDDDGRVHALVRARGAGQEVRGLHRVEVSTTGARIVGEFRLPGTGDREVFCHRVTTAVTDRGLEIRAPDDAGDRELTTVLPRGRALPGPIAAPGDVDVCGEPGQLFVRRSGVELRLDFNEQAAGHRHRVACDGDRCVVAWIGDEGLGVLQLE